MLEEMAGAWLFRRRARRYRRELLGVGRTVDEHTIFDSDPTDLSIRDQID